jgi:hypothetical protein
MDAVTAKQFPISKVIEQAEVEQVSISEVERKMPHFTEVHPCLADTYEVNAWFEQDYDSDQYEAQVATLLKTARNRDREQLPEGDQKWEDALNALKEEDHYILVMTEQAFARGSVSRSSRLQDFLICVAVGVGLVLILLLFVLFSNSH